MRQSGQDDDKEVKRPRCELLHFCWPLSQFENNKIFPRFLVQLTCRQSFVSRISVNTKRKTKNTFSNVHITYSYSCNNVTRQCPSPFSNDISLLSLLLFLFPSQKKTAVYSRLFFPSLLTTIGNAYRFALWRAERETSWERKNLMNVPSPNKVKKGKTTSNLFSNESGISKDFILLPFLSLDYRQRLLIDGRHRVYYVRSCSSPFSFLSYCLFRLSFSYHYYYYSA